jgi:hypothetical protein
LISPDCSPSPKIHQLQCEFLSDKLTQVLKYLGDHLQDPGSSSSPDAHSRQCEHIFKGLYVVSKEVKTFVIDCCKDQWIQAALIMGDQVEYVCLLSSQLDFYEEVFVNSCLFEGHGMTRNSSEEFDQRRVCDIGIIRQKASLDREELLSALATLHPRECSGDQYTLGSNLLKRLQCGYSGGDAGEPRVINDIRAWEIQYKGLKRLARLGKGAFASVHKTTWMGESLAEKSFANDEQKFEVFMNELSILIGLSHPNILSLYCYASNSHSCSLVVKLMDDDLCNFIEEKMLDDTLTAPFDILEAVGIMLQIAEGMHYLHNNKIVHRDLKSGNVLVKLVSAKGEFGVDYVHARVADFGLSKIKEMSHTSSTQTLNIGTTRWMAPELYTASQYDHTNTSTSDVKLRYPFKVDIYSFGMLCYEILTGSRPFYNIMQSQLRERVVEGLRPELPEECPSVLAAMIKRCWEPDPSARPSFSEICEVLRYQKALLILGMKM